MRRALVWARGGLKKNDRRYWHRLRTHLLSKPDDDMEAM
jgi:hypothetical protein